MPLELTDAELATAATACRAVAYQEGERAKKMENPTPVAGQIYERRLRLARLSTIAPEIRNDTGCGLYHAASMDDDIPVIVRMRVECATCGSR